MLDQFVDLFELGIDVGPLINARKECALPVLRFLNRITAGAHRDEPGQVLVNRPQAIDYPGTHAWPREARFAAVHQQQGRLVVWHVRMHGTNHRYVINVFRDSRKQLAHLDAALAVFFELEGRLESSASLALGFQVVHRQRLPVQPG